MHFRILRIDNRFLAIFKELVFLISVAVMAVIYDFFLEPVAIRSGYWTWAGDGTIPLKNYLCWFGLSFLLASAGRLLNVNPSNRMASVLFSIQLIFFIILGMIPG